jgi:hypothetical protein
MLNLTKEKVQVNKVFAVELVRISRTMSERHVS